MSVPNIKNCEFSIPITRMYPVGDDSSAQTNLGRGYHSSGQKYIDLWVPWGHVFEVQFLRATNENESSTYDIDVFMHYGGGMLSSNTASGGNSGNPVTDANVNNTTPYIDFTEPSFKDLGMWLVHEKEVGPDLYVDLLTKDTPIYLSEGMALRFETSGDYGDGWDTKTLAMTISYIDHYN